MCKVFVFHIGSRMLGVLWCAVGALLMLTIRGASNGCGIYTEYCKDLLPHSPLRMNFTFPDKSNRLLG